MKNKEKFIDDIINAFYNDDLCEFVNKHCDYDINCETAADCVECRKKLMTWLEQEYNPKPRLSRDEYIILANLPRYYEWVEKNDENMVVVYASKKKPIYVRDVFRRVVETLTFNDLELTSKELPYLDLFEFLCNEEAMSIYELINEYKKYYKLDTNDDNVTGDEE